MKTKILTFIAALAAIFITSTAFKQNAPEPDDDFGYYKTYDDYLNNNLTKERIIFSGSKYYHCVNNKQQGDPIRFKLKTIWGFRKNGFAWYIDPIEEKYYRILTMGKMCVYCTSDISFETNANGEIEKVLFSYAQGGAFKRMVLISAGPNTEVLMCSKDNLLKVVADDPDISAKVKSKGIYENGDNKWGESLSDVLGWAKEYNDKHK